MSPKTAATAAATAVAAAGLAAALLLAGSGESPPPSPSPAPAPRTAAAPAPAVEEPAPTPAALAGAEDELEASLDAFLGAIPVQPAKQGGRPAEVLARARASGLDPRDYRTALERSLRETGATVEAADLLCGPMADVDPKLRFQHALALASRLDPPGARALLDGLSRAPAAVRPDIVTALRGSDAPEVNAAFVDLYAADDDPAVRERAALAIAERGERVSPHLLERARQRARDDLRSGPTTGAPAAADVLGTPPLEPGDRALLEAILRGPGGDSARRVAAFRALASAQVPPPELEPVARAALADPAADAELRTQLEAFLQALGGAGPPPR